MTQESSTSAPSQGVHAHLQAISELLHHPHRLGDAAQAALAEFVDELDKALKLGTVSDGEAARLAGATSHFAAAVHREEETGVLKAARERLERAALDMERRAPMVSGLTWRFIEALSQVGI